MISAEMEAEYGRRWMALRAREIGASNKQIRGCEVTTRIRALLADIRDVPKSRRADRCARTGASENSIKNDLQKCLDAGLIIRSPGVRGSTTSFSLTQRGQIVASGI